MSLLSFATLDHQYKKKRTKRERFLSEVVVPWATLLRLIYSHHPKAGNRQGYRTTACDNSFVQWTNPGGHASSTN